MIKRKSHISLHFIRSQKGNSFTLSSGDDSQHIPTNFKHDKLNKNRLKVYNKNKIKIQTLLKKKKKRVGL